MVSRISRLSSAAYVAAVGLFMSDFSIWVTVACVLLMLAEAARLTTPISFLTMFSIWSSSSSGTRSSTYFPYSSFFSDGNYGVSTSDTPMLIPRAPAVYTLEELGFLPADGSPPPTPEELLSVFLNDGLSGKLAVTNALLEENLLGA